MDSREKSGEDSKDALQTLLEMRRKVKTDPKYKELGITENVVLAQAWEFFAAGYLGLRDNFEFFIYEVSGDDEVQKRIFSEIDFALEQSNWELKPETFQVRF